MITIAYGTAHGKLLSSLCDLELQSRLLKNMSKFQMNFPYLITVCVIFSSHSFSQELWDSLAWWSMSLFLSSDGNFQLVLHSITSNLPWCNSDGAPQEKHWYNGEEKWPCSALWWENCCHSESVNNSTVFPSRGKGGCEQRGRRALSTILWTLWSQEKLGQEPPSRETLCTEQSPTVCLFCKKKENTHLWQQQYQGAAGFVLRFRDCSSLCSWLVLAVCISSNRAEPHLVQAHNTETNLTSGMVRISFVLSGECFKASKLFVITVLNWSDTPKDSEV